MIALILNSGQGSRLGSLTEKQHKSMLRLKNGETIFGRQIRLLYEAGIRRFVVTTGPFEDQLKKTIEAYTFTDGEFYYINNALYADTNYIYSIWLAREYLDDDVLLLHGDLVFDREYTKAVLNARMQSLGSINEAVPLPEKDFKARIVDGRVVEVSVNLFDEDCVAFQPYYRLSRGDMGEWIEAISSFVERGETSVYAENAGNTIFPSLDIAAFSYEGHLLEEIDTLDDYIRVSELARQYDAVQQVIVQGQNALACFLERETFFPKDARPLLVCGSSFDSLPIADTIIQNFSSVVRFGNFSSNPKIEEVHEGCTVFQSNGCDSIIAVGGGSAIDVAKAVKGFSSMVPGSSCDGEIKYSPIPLLAIPTTAGSGSESTSFAVYYDNGCKISLDNDNLLPSAVILDPRVLLSVPYYQKCSTYFDALSQAIESYWSINSTDLSKQYAAKAMRILKENFIEYFDGISCDRLLSQVQTASNYAGKAINITKTTAPHAMSYVLTTRYGLPHGHAVGLCLPGVWRMMQERVSEKCIDPRGSSYLNKAFIEISNCLGFESVDEAADWYEVAMDRIGLFRHLYTEEPDVDGLVRSVNLERLRNNPVDLDSEDIRTLYCELFGKKQ